MGMRPAPGEGKTMKPERLGTVWTARALIRIIDDSTAPPRWLTVASCIDTPAAIGNAFAAARRNHPGKTLWVHSETRGKYIPQ